MRLSQLQNSQKGVIVKVKGHGAFRKRIIEMGFIKGKTVTVIKNAPLKDPIEYRVMDYQVSLRRCEAQLIEVISEKEAQQYADTTASYSGILQQERLKSIAFQKRKSINIAFVGNPNCGKTTLFNHAVGAHEHVGNYSGVTVDAKSGSTNYKGYKLNIVDLPGTYSLSAYTQEERYVRQHIRDEVPDIIVNVVAASNLERNLYLTTQLIDMDLRLVVALNMYDELEKSGAVFNHTKLGKMLGIPFVPTVGSKGTGINNLFDEIIAVYEGTEPHIRHIHINYGEEIEKAITAIRDHLNSLTELTNKLSPRHLALKLIEGDKEGQRLLKEHGSCQPVTEEVNKQQKRLQTLLSEEPETAIMDAKYGFIAGALKETLKAGKTDKVDTTRIIDSFMTHKLFGFPIFLFFMWLMFWSTFKLGAYPMGWIESGVEILANLVSGNMTEGPLKDLISDGIFGGVGGVIIFLPNILILYFFISFMEDSGYMARAAFIMDKLMHKMGLHGKSFIPLIMGFGCNVPAIMASRTLENRNSRILTMLINPLMSCSARLPVYILIIGTFFPESGENVLLLIYATGIFFAVVIARLFKKFLFKSEEIPFVMELPPYRLPSLQTTLRHMWHKGAQYLKKMGGIILIASVLIWFLGYYPKNVEYSRNYTAEIAHIEQAHQHMLSQIPLQVQPSINRHYAQKIKELQLAQEAEHQEKSYIGKIGKFIEPAIAPLGFNWKIGVSLVSGIAAKELVVSTLGVLFQTDDNDKNMTENLQQKLRAERWETGPRKGEPVFNTNSAISLLLFVLLYFPCIAAVTAIKTESGSLKWALFAMFYTTALAWIVSFSAFQIGQIL